MDRELEFEARNQRLKDVFFTPHTKFRVPRYQRPYEWTEDHVSDFWHDLTGEEYSHFIGSFIFNSEQYDRTGYYDIIDGQQRLMTITIFCAVLRDIAKQIDTKTADFFHRYDIAIEDIEGNRHYRILCGGLPPI